jgi:hypothetical protein
MVILDFGFWLLDFGIGDYGVRSMRKNYLPLGFPFPVSRSYLDFTFSYDVKFRESSMIRI